MKKYIKPEVKVYNPNTEYSLLTGSVTGEGIKGKLPEKEDGSYVGFSKGYKGFDAWTTWDE